VTRIALVFSAAALLAVSLVAGAGASRTVSHGAGLPIRGVFIPGKSLGGVSIGMTQTQVRALWGNKFKVCPQCTAPTWNYVYSFGEPLGAAVKFSKTTKKVIAVYTLGSPAGWHSAEGLLVGEEVDKVNTLYGKTGWTACIGYGAMILQKGAVNTAVYTTGAVVYGFAMTAGNEPICQ
jgi:outer membrane protein assembly factor BamE (lipoprotein component of BamABCDE complex)